MFDPVSLLLIGASVVADVLEAFSDAVPTDGFADFADSSSDPSGFTPSSDLADLGPGDTAAPRPIWD